MRGNRGNPAPNMRVVSVAELNLLTEIGAATIELEMKNESEGASQKSAKTAAELESMIMAELREYPECESAAVAVIGATSVDPWDAVLIREGTQIADECEARLAEITSRLRQEFDLAHSSFWPWFSNSLCRFLSFPKILSGLDSRRKAESSHHWERCLRCCARSACSSLTCSSRAADLRPRICFSAIS
jgi:hypothetical protein